MKRLFAVLLLALLALAAPASAQTFPQLTGRVVDQADLLRPEQELDLSSKSEALQAQTGRQFVVATVKTLEGRPIEDYAYQLGRHWGIGQKEEDDGVILLVAPNERKVWIATGYGAGAFLTDALSGVIIRERILPEFRKNPPDYAAGITAGANAIIEQMKLPPEEAQANVAQARKQESGRHQAGAGFLPILFIMIVLFILFSSFARRHSGRRYRRRRGGVDPFVVLWGLSELGRSRGSGWGGGGFGGGSWGGGGGGGFGGFSGGGGSFGGGGAGGSW